ncbi:MAG TPA: S49 family peptidase [Alphaproteobacteria bacterium]|nr:S49 family peptidase [Alphaproteobacteria bacterium]
MIFFGSSRPVVAVLRLNGVIGRVGPVRAGLTLAGLAGMIERAFQLKHLKAVALTINSPGGSPVQSALIHSRIRALAEEKEIPILAFAEDVAASGGYWLACAGDEIYANENSIVGSIGVVSAGFGFPDMLKRFGIERRVYTAGERKAILDPFRPENPEDIAHLRTIQVDIHDSFKALVRARRGKRLKGAEKDMFSGAFWTGRKALELGLIDGIGDLRTVTRDRFGEKVKLKVMEPSRGWLRRRLGISAPSLGGDAGLWADQLIAAVEERFLWNRFGL